MTDDHAFIDSAGNTISGKERCVEAWKGFFAAFPDYRNHFELFLLAGGEPVVIGHSVCSDIRLAGPALWAARIEDGLIAQWPVYEDTRAIRALLGVKGWVCCASAIQLEGLSELGQSRSDPEVRLRRGPTWPRRALMVAHAHRVRER